MMPFAYHRAASVDEALRLGAAPGAKFLGGGTNLVDLMRGGVVRPLTLVDITRLPLADIDATAGRRLRIGALVRNSDVGQPSAGARPLSAAVARRCWPARRRSCATWPPWAATCCSAPAARTSTTRFRALQQARAGQRLRRPRRHQPQPRDPRRERSSASPRIRRTCASRSRRCDAVVRVPGPRGERHDRRSTDFHRLPGDAPQRRHDAGRRRTGHRASSCRPTARRRVALPQGARPRELRVRAGLGGGGARGARRRRARRGARRAGRRRAQAVAARRGRGGCWWARRPPTTPSPCRRGGAGSGARPSAHNGFKMSWRAARSCAALQRRGARGRADIGQAPRPGRRPAKVTGGARYAAEYRCPAWRTPCWSLARSRAAASRAITRPPR